MLQAYTALILGAVVPIYVGASASVKPPSKKATPQTAGHDADDEDTSESDDDGDEERLTKEDAYLFPVLGSAVLVTLYLLFKHLPRDLLSALMAAYFSLVSAAAVSRPLHSVILRVLPTSWSHRVPRYRFHLSRSDSPAATSKGKARPKSTVPATLFKTSFTTLNVAAAVLAVVVSAYEWWTRDWYLTDLIAECLAFNAIAMIKLDGFKTGAILLGGLFWYDVYWVFGSSKAFGESVMVAVAKNMEAPVKITWPKSLSVFTSAKQSDMTMLGLGDIVIPGIFVALALRYDYHVACQTLTQRRHTVTGKVSRDDLKQLAASGRYSKPYFKTCFVAYILGLVTTMGVMHFFKAAQPALLYLSPACVGSVSLLAWLRGESEAFWSWDDGQVKPEQSKETKSVTGTTNVNAVDERHESQSDTDQGGAVKAVVTKESSELRKRVGNSSGEDGWTSGGASSTFAVSS